MYVRLSNNETKSYYRQVLDETTKMVLEIINLTPEILIYNSIYNQLIDINKNIIDEENYTEHDKIKERYNFGIIAVRNFEIEDPLYYRLCDLYAGVRIYKDLPE